MAERYPFVNTPLPYAYDALEPYIDSLTMELHHDRHLQAYIDNLNALLADQPRLQNLSLEELLSVAPALPEPLATQIRRNAGGVYNHQFYFNNLAPAGMNGGAPGGRLLAAIQRDFGSIENMLQALGDAAMSVFGSGYAWLNLQPEGMLGITTTTNQNTPLPDGLLPLLNVDMWEHAYYLKHYNDRDGYLNDWMNVINWPQAEQHYLAGLGMAA